jgi:hypothetical protein
MSYRVLQFLVDPESSQIETQHTGAAGMSPGRTMLRVKAFYPGLTERIIHGLQQGYCEMLSGDIFVGILFIALQIIFAGGKHFLDHLPDFSDG